MANLHVQTADVQMTTLERTSVQDVGRRDNVTPPTGGRTMVFVYVLGIASANHNPRPLRKPRASALTRSRTMRPSSRATATLRTVRKMRKKLCARRSAASLECQDGRAIRRIARSCRRKVLSRFGFCEGGSGGKWVAVAVIKEAGVGRMRTCAWVLASVSVPYTGVEIVEDQDCRVRPDEQYHDVERILMYMQSREERRTD